MSSAEKSELSKQSGTLKVPAFDLPLSAALSTQTRAMLGAVFDAGVRMDMPDSRSIKDEAEFRNAVDAFRERLDNAMLRPLYERLLANFPVRTISARIGSVAVEEFSPSVELDSERVLINLHGGAFYSGWPYVARIESIPVAHRGKFRVISVDYRQGYEHKFPAASEDVAAVYAELLKQYAPSHIGIYGASAGGMLTSQATAWMIEKKMPVPGAIGIFSAGTGGAGDSDYFAAIGTAQTPPFKPMAERGDAPVGYFSGTRRDDYLVDPSLAPEPFRAKFPPTLIITGTRAFDMSPAIATHRALVQAGVDASLHVFDGVAHAFFYESISPESVDAYNTMIRFFRKHLSPKP